MQAHPLTPRELEVLRLAAQGLKNHEIAARLALAPKTIEHMLGSSDPYRSIYAKIGAANRAEAVAWYSIQFGDSNESKAAERLSEHLLEMFWDYAGRIYALRIAGQPRLAASMADFLIAQTAQAANETTAAATREAYLRVCARALSEQGSLYLETSARKQVLTHTRPVALHLRAIAQELKDADLLGLSHAIWAGAYNIDKRFQMGRRLYAQAFAEVQRADLQLRALRGLAIAATFLQDKDEVMAVAQKTQAMIDAGQCTNLEQVCETLEGVGRAQGIMGSKKAVQWFESAERMLPTLNYPPLRRVQIIESKLEVLYRTEPAAVIEFERIGQDGLRLAEQHGYARHQALLVGMLEKTLNA